MEFTVLLIVAYFAVLAVSLRKRQRKVNGPWLFLLRAFFPNWQFFHGLGPAARLWVRARSGAGHWSDWHLVYPRLPRRAAHLVHNPAVNLALSQQNLVEHLASDVHGLSEQADIRDCVSYQLVTRGARCRRGWLLGQRPIGAAPRLVGTGSFSIRSALAATGPAKQ